MKEGLDQFTDTILSDHSAEQAFGKHHFAMDVLYVRMHCHLCRCIHVANQ